MPKMCYIMKVKKEEKTLLFKKYATTIQSVIKSKHVVLLKANMLCF